jgi:hypothetical protein
VRSASVTVGAFQYSNNIGSFFFSIDYVAALEEEDADVVLLSVLVATLEPEATTSPVMGEVWSVPPIMMKWELVRCSKH